MSLIADALKSAESERSGASARARDTARQIFQGRPQRRVPISGAAVWLYRPIRLPRHIRIAGGIVGGAVVLATAIVVLRPVSEGALTDQLATASLANAFGAGDGGAVLNPGASEEGVIGEGGSTPGVELAVRAPVQDGSTGSSAKSMARGDPGLAPSAGVPLIRAESAGVTRDVAFRPAPTETAPIPDESRADASPAAPSAAAPETDLESEASIASTGDARLEIATLSEPRQLSSNALRVNARERANADLFADAVAAQQSRDYAGAVATYNEILSLDPNDVEVLNNLGVSYQALGGLEAARDAFQRALSIEPRYAAAWSNLGVVLGRLGQDADARTALAEAIRQDPGNLGTKVNLALLHQRQGLVAESKRLLQEVLGVDPGVAEAHFALAGILETEGSFSAALRHYRQFISTSQGRYPQYEPIVANRIAALEGRQ